MLSRTQIIKIVRTIRISIYRKMNEEYRFKANPLELGRQDAQVFGSQGANPNSTLVGQELRLANSGQIRG